MALLIENNGEIFIGLLQDVDNDGIRLVVSNLSEFFSETISKSDFLDRLEDVNHAVQISSVEKVNKIMLSKPPDSSEIKRDGNGGAGVQFELSYKVAGGKQMLVTFDTKRADDGEKTAFLSSLLVTALENNLLVKRMKLELERKDAEIEDYKSNGAVLVRGALATAKFNFDDMRETETVDRQNSLQSLNQILVKENLPGICRLINLDTSEADDGNSKGNSSAQEQKSSKSSKVIKSQLNRKVKPMTVKNFSYDNEDGSESFEQPETSQAQKRTRDGRATAATAKEDTTRRKTREIVKKFL